MLGAPSPQLTKPSGLPLVLCLSLCVSPQLSVFPSLFILAVVKALLQLHLGFLLLTVFNPPQAKMTVIFLSFLCWQEALGMRTEVLHQGKDIREWGERFACAWFSIFWNWCSFCFNLVFVVLCLLLKCWILEVFFFPLFVPLPKVLGGTVSTAYLRKPFWEMRGTTGNPSVLGLQKKKKKRSVKIWV